jgi:hypothetical protein
VGVRSAHKFTTLAVSSPDLEGSVFGADTNSPLSGGLVDVGGLASDAARARRDDKSERPPMSVNSPTVRRLDPDTGAVVGELTLPHGEQGPDSASLPPRSPNTP